MRRGEESDRLVKMELERPRGSRLGGKAKTVGWGWGAGPVLCLSYLISYLIFFVDGVNRAPDYGGESNIPERSTKMDAVHAAQGPWAVMGWAGAAVGFAGPSP